MPTTDAPTSAVTTLFDTPSSDTWSPSYRRITDNVDTASVVTSATTYIASNVTALAWNVTSSNGTTSNHADSDMAEDAIWILTSTFIIFTMQSGESDHPPPLPVTCRLVSVID